MEDILASIRRIIADEVEPSSSTPAPAAPRAAEPAAVPVTDEVLELTNAIDPAPSQSATLSTEATEASRDKLAALSALIVKAQPGSDNTLEGLVREMLRPMLKDWLDQRLPLLVEHLVEKEIARITGRSL